MTYNRVYKVRVTPLNICGAGYNPVSIDLTTKVAPSAPLVAFPPVKTALSATLITVTWPALGISEDPALGISEDETGGYAITGYQLLRAISPINSTTVFTVLYDGPALTFSQTSGWLWNTTYEYQVRAKNSLGLGVSSTSLIIKTSIDPALCTLPTGMSMPTLVDVSPLSVTLNWTELTDARNGGDYPIFYQVEWSLDNSTWTALNAGGGLVFSYTHTVTTPFASGASIYYRLKAANNVGLGAPSSALLVVGDKVPQGMTALEITTVNPKDITISWSPLDNSTLNGGDLPIFYSVEWSPDQVNWTQLNTDGPLSLTYTHAVAAPFAGGSTQYYRVKPKNNAGMGIAYSPKLSVLCDTIPSGAPTLTLVEVNPKNVTVAWTELADVALNGRDLPTFYSLEFTTSAASTNWTALNTDGVLAFEYTHTSLTIFNSSFTLMFRVRAQNGVGFSNVYSQVLVVTPDTKPVAMTAPSLISVSVTSIFVKWEALTDPTMNGGDLPIFYSLEYSPNSINWSVLNTDETKPLIFNYTISPGTVLTNKAFFRVRAENGVGLSDFYSPVLTVVCPSGNYSTSICNVNPKNITICWSEASATWGNGALPTFYQVEWLNPSQYGTNCNQVPANIKSNVTIPSSNNPASVWKIISSTSANDTAKFTSFQHNLPPGIFAGDVFPSGQTQCYRVRPFFNGVPQVSTAINYVQVGADSVPGVMAEPVLVEINPYNATVKWSELVYPFNGGDAITFYQLEWYNYDTQKWQALTSKSTTGKVLQYTHVRTGSVYSVSQQLRYRVIAENGVGMGTIYSPELVSNPDTEPIGMDPLFIVSVTPYSITVGWPELTASLNGGDPPYYYELEWYNNATGTWTKMINNTELGKLYSYTHAVTTMFPPNTYQLYRVLPLNLVGWGRLYSDVLSVLTDTYPGPVATPISVSVNPKDITVAWTPLTQDADTGRDPILFYCLEWDQETGEWAQLSQETNGIITSYTLTKTTIFNPNSYVSFRVKAKNTIGYGDYSTQLSVLTDGPPTKMNTPTATLIEPKKVSLKWTGISSAADTGRDPVVYYRLDFLNRPCYQNFSSNCLTESLALGSWAEVTQETVQLANLTFVHTFTSILKPDEIFYYRVCPKNGIGFGACSDNFTFLSDTYPTFMYPPVVLASQITPTSISITWAAITSDLQTGRDPIIFYDLQMSTGSSYVSLLNDTVNGLVQSFTVVNASIFPNGGTYYFKLRAKNNVGYGPYSVITPVLCDGTPQTMNAPTVLDSNIYPSWIWVSWNSITDCTLSGRDCPTYYGLEWDQGPGGTWVNLTVTSMGLINSFNATAAAGSVFSSGSLIRFRTYAKNGVGFGDYSTILSVTADRVPTYMNTPVMNLAYIYPKWITIFWQKIYTQAQTGGDPVTYYEVSYDQGNSTWITLTNESMGMIFQYNLTSSVAFPSGQQFQFKLRAKNGVGIGAYSSVLTVNADQVPQYMNTPSCDLDTYIAPKWMYITWQGILDSQNGGDEVTYYELQWLQPEQPATASTDLIPEQWVVLTTDGGIIKTSFNFTRSEIFPSASIQKFRMRAQNGVGFGLFSGNLSVTADSVPLYMNTPVVNYLANDINPQWIYVTWAPIQAANSSQTGGDDATQYELQWDQGSDGTNWTSVTVVDADPYTMLEYGANVTTATGAPPLPSNQTQQFRARAKNGVGLGAFSEVLKVQSDSVPLYMNRPFVDTTLNHVNPRWIYLTWQGISLWNETGGDSIIYYQVEWDQGTNGANWTVLTNPTSTGLVYAFNHTVDIPYPSGSQQLYRIRAQNGVGLGACSAPLTVVADLVPQFMSIPKVDLASNQVNPKWILITWDGISGTNQTGGDEPVFYGLEWDQGLGSSANNWTNLTFPSMGMVQQFNLTSVSPFPSGMIIQFRAFAVNGVGKGVYSEILEVVADKVPQYMVAPVVKYSANHINPTWIYITWTGISSLEDTGGDPATYYGLEWDRASGQWENVTTVSMGMIFSFNLTSTTPFASACTIKLRTYAQNGVGFGVYSEIVTITADSIPLFMYQPQVNYLANHINPRWIYVTWQGITGDNQTGGDDASHYGLEWDQGNSTWLRLTSESQGLIQSFNLTSPQVPFPSNMTIKLRTIAKNGVGFGAYSSVTTINADSVPLIMNAPLELQVDYNAIYFNWSAISQWSETGGDDIIYYKVEFLYLPCYDGDLLNCTGQPGTWLELTQASVQGIKTDYRHYNSTSHFSMDKNFSYRICAANGVGMGACSLPTQILTDTIPQKMQPPELVEVFHDQTILRWNQVTEFNATGRSPVNEYKLQWDEYKYDDYDPNGLEQVQWKDCGGTVDQTNDTTTQLQYIHEVLPNFISKRKIMYRIQAINNVGAGPFSEPFQVITVDRVWSKPHSWGGQLPSAGDNIELVYGQNWTFDLKESPIYGNVFINSLVAFKEDAAELHLKARNIIIKQGQLVVGTAEQPFGGKAQITLFGGKGSPSYYVSKNVQGGNKLLANFGELRLYGLPRSNRTSLLRAVANPGDNSLLLQPNLTWVPGDRIALPPSTMLYKQAEYAQIRSYDPQSGQTVLEEPLLYYHYGAPDSTAPQYSGIDMRNEVYLLTRNIVIQGEDVENWGCQILTSSLDSSMRGRTIMDNVEIANCSQYEGMKAALRFQDTLGQQQVISNSALHDGTGIALLVDNSDNVNFINSIVFSFAKYGVNISASNNVNLVGNHISAIRTHFYNESTTSEVQPAGIVGCIESDCLSLKILNNFVSGVGYAGFITASHECGDSANQQSFRNNIAHSINGYGTVYFTNQQSFSQVNYCVEGSHFAAYKCAQGGVIVYNATQDATLSNMILIDNHIGGTVMIGDESNENNTQLAIFKDSIFYGETEARDCPVKDSCVNSFSSEECVERMGLMISYFSHDGKEPLVKRAKDLPLHKVTSDATYGGDIAYRNLTFSNYRSLYTWCGTQQRTMSLNPTGADYHPRSKFFDTKFIDIHQDTLVNLFAPPHEWINNRLCGQDVCSGPLNTFLSFESTSFSGPNTPKFTSSDFQVASYVRLNAGRFPDCSYVASWNAYYCQNKKLAILLFESRESDKYTKLLTPIVVRNDDYQTVNEINSFMSHQETVVTNIQRLSRWPSLVQSGKLIEYSVTYNGAPPVRQKYTLVADQGDIIVNIKYPKAGAYILRDRQSKQIAVNAWDDDKKVQVPIKGLYCGENRYDERINTLQFLLTPNCSIWIEGTDVLQTNIRLNWTLKAFQDNGGIKDFKTKLSDSLKIKPTFIKVLNVKEGSVIVDFQIIQAEEDSNFNLKGGLTAIKTDLYKKIATQNIWLGAPILDATVTGQAITISGVQKTVFDATQDWHATGKEVWIPPPAPIVLGNKTINASVIIVSSVESLTEVQEEASFNSRILALIIGCLLAFFVFFCIVGFFIYRRYKKKQEEKQAQDISDAIDQAQKKKQQDLDLVNESGASPLKSFHDVTIYDDEEHDAQYHPSQDIQFTYLYEKEFSTVRKANEGDNLIGTDERRTGDNFYEKEMQPTFGQKDAKEEEDSISRSNSSDNEGDYIVGDLDVVDEEVNQPQKLQESTQLTVQIDPQSQMQVEKAAQDLEEEIVNAEIEVDDDFGDFEIEEQKLDATFKSIHFNKMEPVQDDPDPAQVEEMMKQQDVQVEEYIDEKPEVKEPESLQEADMKELSEIEDFDDFEIDGEPEEGGNGENDFMDQFSAVKP